MEGPHLGMRIEPDIPLQPLCGVVIFDGKYKHAFEALSDMSVALLRLSKARYLKQYELGACRVHCQDCNDAPARCHLPRTPPFPKPDCFT